jgi:hypothetical protein
MKNNREIIYYCEVFGGRVFVLPLFLSMHLIVVIVVVLISHPPHALSGVL